MGRARCTLVVRGLDCPAEVPPIRSALERGPGVLGLAFDPPQGRVAVDYDPGATSPDTLVARIADGARMTAEVADDSRPADSQPAPWYREPRWLVTFASGGMLGLGVIGSYLSAPEWLEKSAYLAAIVAGGALLVPKAIRSALAGRLDIHGLMALAVVGALALGQWDEAATVAFLFGLSEALEALSLERAKRAIGTLLEVVPETAERIEPDGSVAVVDARQVSVGDRVRVRAGERVPVDGQIADGRSSLDQRAITGEPLPVAKGPGDPVFAGTVNGEGTLEVIATRLASDSVAKQIVDQVRSAQAGRAPAERTIERFTRVYTPIVVAMAVALTLLPPLARLAMGMPGEWSLWLYRGLVILVVACPCALVIGTPVAVVSALAAAARRGILIKGGQYLEAFGRLKTLAFDKTGTLTLGEPDVVEVVPAMGRGDDDLLKIAAALGDRGNHVVGRAIAKHARGLRLEVPEAKDYRAVPGLGATATVGSTQYHLGNHRYLDEAGLCPPEFHTSLNNAETDVGTSVALTGDGGPLGWIRLADRPRPEAAGVVTDLKALGIDAVMLTGDNARTAAAMGEELGIADRRAHLLPDDKARIIGELNAKAGPVGMVGDGVNDAPALAAADVSVALRGISSGAALETADVVLMSDDLAGLPWLVRHSRRSVSRIHQNIAMAVGSKALVMVLAAFGLATLWMAIAADVGVSLIVVANALRLLKPEER